MRRWLAFLRNHREVTAAMDFFTVPTSTFQVLYYGFFVIAHDRRRTLLFNRHRPSQQPVDHPTFDRVAEYGLAVPATVRNMGIE